MLRSILLFKQTRKKSRMCSGVFSFVPTGVHCGHPPFQLRLVKAYSLPALNEGRVPQSNAGSRQRRPRISCYAAGAA